MVSKYKTVQTGIDLGKTAIPGDIIPLNQTNGELPKFGYDIPGYANTDNRFYYPVNISTLGQSDISTNQTPIPSIPVPLNAGSTVSTGFDNSRAVPSNNVFDNSVANAEKMILNGSLGNGKKVRRDAWLALGGSAEAYEQAQANINKRFASKAVRRNTNIASRKPSQQDVMARRAQQDELLRQSMLRAAQQNPNSSVRANMPSHFNSSTTMQQYYLNNPDLWR